MPPTPSSSAQCLHAEATSQFPPIPSTGPGGSPVPSWAQRQSLDHLRLCFWQGSGLQGPVCILFWSSHILPWRKSWKRLLVTGINITSVLYSHNCDASPIPPPDPICQTSFLLDLISFGTQISNQTQTGKATFLLKPGLALLASSQKLSIIMSNHVKWKKEVKQSPC